MSKTFRAWDVDQEWLLPPSVHDFVPAGHLAHFVRETVREGLDLSAIRASYAEERGYPPYHPGMMVALLLYAYSRGVYSSRRIAQACEERVDFMAVTGLNKPDFRTISEFRRRHLAALAGLFAQVLKLCQAAGLVKLGHVAVDGTKLKANASRHKAMSYGRMKQAEPKLKAEVEAWLRQAEAADRAEDAEHGAELRGDEMPDWVADKQKRLERIREARARLEAEAKADPSDPDADGPGPSSGMARGERKRAPDAGVPDKAQRNFTDPDSRIQPSEMASSPATTARSRSIRPTRSSSPRGSRPTLPTMRRWSRWSPRPRPPRPQAPGGLRRQRLRHGSQSRSDGHAEDQGLPAARTQPPRRRPCRRRTAAEKQAQDGRHGRHPEARRPTLALSAAKTGRRARLRPDQASQRLRQFLLRGLAKVRGEWALICTAHNLLKLAKARP
jgi:transposase